MPYQYGGSNPYGSGSGRDYRRGWGYGPGWGWNNPIHWGYPPALPPWAMWGAWQPPTPEEEEQILLDYKEYLENELKNVEARLRDLRKEAGGE